MRQSFKQHRNILITIFRMAGLTLGLFLIYWFVSKCDLNIIWEHLKGINIKFALIIGVTFISQLLVTIAWMQSFYETPKGISVWEFFNIRLMGETLALINPTSIVAGETMKAVLLKKRKNIPYKESVASLTISRFTIVLSITTLIAIGITLVMGRLEFSGALYVIPMFLAVAASVFAVFFFLLIRGKEIFSLPILLVKRLFRIKKLTSLYRKLRMLDRQLVYFFRNKKDRFMNAYILSLLHWFGGTVEFYLILHFIGIDVSFLSCIIIEVGVMVFKAMGAFVPGQIGVEEYGNKLMLAFVNVPGAEIWITVSIIRRARQLFWIGLGSLMFFIITAKNIRKGDGMPKLPGSEEYGTPVHNS